MSELLAYLPHLARTLKPDMGYNERGGSGARKKVTLRDRGPGRSSRLCGYRTAMVLPTPITTEVNEVLAVIMLS